VRACLASARNHRPVPRSRNASVAIGPCRRNSPAVRPRPARSRHRQRSSLLLSPHWPGPRLPSASARNRPCGRHLKNASAATARCRLLAITDARRRPLPLPNSPPRPQRNLRRAI
jgi:hypothetical protein